MARRRHRGQGSVYQRPNGTWSAQIDLGTGPDGKRRRRTVYSPTHDGILKEIDKARRALDDRGDLATSDVTVEKWLRLWLTDIAFDRTKPSTYRSYKTAVECHLIPTVGRYRLNRLTIAHLRQMRKSLTTPKPAGPGLSITTAGNAQRVLSAALSDAMREGRVGQNIAQIAGGTSKARSKRKGLSREATMKALTAASGDRLGSRWLAAFLLGLRQGERLALRWSALDLDNGFADVSWALGRVSWAHNDGCGRTARSCHDRYMPIPDGFDYETLHGNLVLMRPKSEDSRRIIPLPGPLVVALRARLEAVKAERYGYAADLDLVWCELDGRPIDPRRDWQAWGDLLVAAGLPHVTLHEARHTTATLLLDAKVDPHVAAAILGHSDVIVTRGYQHVDTSLSRRALDDLGRMLELES